MRDEFLRRHFFFSLVELSSLLLSLRTRIRIGVLEIRYMTLIFIFDSSESSSVLCSDRINGYKTTVDEHLFRRYIDINALIYFSSIK